MPPNQSLTTAVELPIASFVARWILPATTLLFYLLTTHGYGYHRDELYYIANGEHLGFGYVDHPPFVGLVSAFVANVFGKSLFAIRLLPALAATATVWIVGAIARELGGKKFAQILAAVSTFLTPIFLSVFSYFSMNSFDVLIWAITWWIVTRILRTGNQRLWLLFGLVMGIGLQNKISVLFLGFGVVVGLVLCGRWEVFRSKWFWLGGVIAILMFVPHLLWQQAYGWPTLEFMENARNEKMVEMPTSDFLKAQILQMNPIAFLVWFSGLLFFLFDSRSRPYRVFGWAYLGILLVMITAHAKPYYLAPAYTILFAGGSVAIETWTSGRKYALAIRGFVMVLVFAGGLLLIPFAKPVLSEDTYARYAKYMGVQPSTDERHELARLPQFYADMHGWPELAETVATVYRQLPPEDQKKACIFGQNYGEAGAIDVFGPALGLPKALSAHNSYYLWGPRDCTGDVWIVIGDDRKTLEQLFEAVQLGATFTCQDCMPYENNNPIWIARRLKQPVSKLWPDIKHYD